LGHQEENGIFYTTLSAENAKNILENLNSKKVAYFRFELKPYKPTDENNGISLFKQNYRIEENCEENGIGECQSFYKIRGLIIGSTIDFSTVLYNSNN
jgi:hypothetical protein